MSMRIFIIILQLCSYHTYGEDQSSPSPRQNDTPAATTGTGNLSDVINTALAGYDHFIRPQIEQPNPMIIKVGIHIEAITYVDEQSMEFEAIIYLRQTWEDTRLKFTFPDSLKRMDYIPLPHDFVEYIWIPDTYFPSEKDSMVHEASVRNQAFKWYPNGTIFFTTRITVKTICSMDLTNFPMDYQVCSLLMESYAYNDRDVVYAWETNFDPLTFNENALKLLTQFKLRGHRQSSTTESLISGNFTLLECEFLLDRTLGYYLVAFYIPALLVTIIAGFAFYMDVALIPERLALGVTTMLTITTLLLAIHTTEPKISYVKATDIFLGFCFTGVFLALGQSAFISFLYGRTSIGRKILEERHKKIPPLAASELVVASEIEQKSSAIIHVGDVPKASVQSLHQPRSPIQTDQSIMTSKTSSAQTTVSATAAAESFSSNPEETGWRNFCVRCCRCQCGQKNYDGLARRLDKIGRIAFPLALMIFNLIYWIYFMNAETIQKDKSWETKRTVGAGRAFF